MAISKELKAALDAWKKGEGEFPGSLDTGVFFETDGAYMADVNKKSKSKATQAADAARAELLAKLGVETAEDIDGLLSKVKSSEGQTTEMDKLKGTLDKVLKKHSDLEKQATALQGFKVSALKQKALLAHAAKVRDPDVLDALIASKLVVGDDDTVTGPDGKDVGKLVDELLAAKSYLKSPDFIAGPGTKPNTQKINVPYAEPDEAAKKNGAKLTVGQVMVNEMVAQGKLPAPPVSGP